jgi:hypothetical protein
LNVKEWSNNVSANNLNAVKNAVKNIVIMDKLKSQQQIKWLQPRSLISSTLLFY